MELESEPVANHDDVRSELATLLEEFRSRTVVADGVRTVSNDDLSPAVEANLQDLGYR